MQKAKPELRFTLLIYIPLAILAPIWLFLSVHSVSKTIFYFEIFFNAIVYSYLIYASLRRSVTTKVIPKKLTGLTHSLRWFALTGVLIFFFQTFLILFHQQFLANLNIPFHPNDLHNFLLSLPFTLLFTLKFNQPFTYRPLELCRIYYLQQTQFIWLSSNLTVMSLGTLVFLYSNLQFGIYTENFLLATIAMIIAQSSYVLRGVRYLAAKNKIAVLLLTIIIFMILLTFTLQWSIQSLPFYKEIKPLFSALTYNAHRETWYRLISQLWWLGSISMSTALLYSLKKYLSLQWLLLLYVISGFSLYFIFLKFHFIPHFSLLLLAGLLIILQKNKTFHQSFYRTLHPHKKIRVPIIAFRALTQNLFLVFSLFLLLPFISYLFLAWLGIMPLMIIYLAMLL